ncbi:hypothetical protein ACUXOD_003887 [Bacillus sp. 153480037-1]
MKKKIIAGIAVATIAVGGFGGAYVYNKQAEAKEIAKVEANESNHFKAAIAAVRTLNKNLNEKNLLAAKEKTELVSDKTAKKSLLADIEQAEKKINFSKELNKASNKKGVLKPGVTKKQIGSLEKALDTIHDKKFVNKESIFLKSLSQQLKSVEKSNKALKAGVKSEKDIDLVKKEISKIKNLEVKREMQKKLAKLKKRYVKSKEHVAVVENKKTVKSNSNMTGNTESSKSVDKSYTNSIQSNQPNKKSNNSGTATTGSSKPSNSNKSKSNYGSTNSGKTNTKQVAPKNSTSNGTKTGEGKIENHAGTGKGTYSYDKHTYSEKDLDVPWDELNK